MCGLVGVCGSTLVPVAAHRTSFLLLDVDGVLNPVLHGGGLPGFSCHGVEASNGREHVVWLNPQHGLWLNMLAGRFELVWATGWEHDAPRILGPLLGLQPFRVIEFTQRPAMGVALRKLPDVQRFVGEEPVAWVDDDLGGDIRRWARRRAAPTLLVQPDRHVGLVRGHVDELLAFADRTSTIQ
jgi:hypothetical protein